MFVTGAGATERQERVVHSFGGGKDGNEVNASLVLDPAGNLYGTTTGGGAYQSGTAYELSFQATGGWKETRLHDFGKGSDGGEPSASVTLDPAGNLYGTTALGGAYGCGTAFELTPGATGIWTEKILYDFSCPGNRNYPAYSNLIFDSAGNLYGTALWSGAYGQGAVFELTPAVSGRWTQQILHTFNSNLGDGVFPVGGLIFDAAGHLYGTTSAGGTRGGGTVFELSSTTAGWSESILHNFIIDGTNGSTPEANLAIDATGNLYGTTTFGGSYHKGAVFELTLTAGGWTEKVLHSFDPNGTDGFSPHAGVILDAAGNLYGTTPNGGSNWIGVVFELAPKGNGRWTETILHSFRANGIDGTGPFLGLTLDASGSLYGTTTDGGIYCGSGNCGTVYEVIP
jgi:uncharacterized repeat protein (TIGR03803 family)